MGRKKKESNSDVAELVELALRPEEVVKYYAQNGNLPDGFNPYGNYMPEESRFLGDVPPNDTVYFVGINTGDDDLTPIYISTPTPPPEHLIVNYGLPVEEQIWKRPEIPLRLKKLEEKAFLSMYEIEKRNRQETVQSYKVYQKFWEMLNAEQSDYAEEIQWMKHIWWWRIFGYWLFIDGVPTHMTGDFFDYLSFWYLKEAEIYPDYRDEDRVIAEFSHYLENTTETFEEIDLETGRAKKNEDGTYHMIDIGARTFFGEMTPKFRRAGETQRGCHKVWKGTSTTPAAYGTIISMDGDNAEKHYYKKLIPAWNKYPMFLKPIWMGSKRPTSIKMIEPPNVFHIEGLGSTIDFAESGGISKNDGDTLYFSLQDEEGKDPRAQIFERWNVNKIAMSRGGGTKIIGYSMHPSTVEEMDSAGMEYYKLAQLSCFYERMPVTGQTYSGLARIFIPAYRKMDGFIDRWGKSVIENPTERQRKASPRSKFAITGKGARETLQSQLDALAAKGTPEALEAYRSRRRKFPMKWADCWLGAAGNVGFNLEIIDGRLEELNRMRSFGKMNYKVGYFDRANKNDSQSDVIWITDPENSKFRISLDLPPEFSNRRIKGEYYDSLKGIWRPSWSPMDGYRFTLGVDMFRNLTPVQAKQVAKFGGTLTNSRQSNGGIAIYWERDSEYPESGRCVLSYNYRPATQVEFMNDVLMAAQYFGAMIYPEQNVERFIEYMYDMGYGGYGLHDLDMTTGKMKPLPGRYTTNDVLQEIFREYKDYIEAKGAVEEHDDLLTQVKNIRGTEDATRNDLFVAFGMCLLGSRSRHREIIRNEDNSDVIDIDGLF